MATDTIMIGMFSMFGVLLLFVIIAYIIIQRKGKKSEKAALTRTLKESKEKSGLSKTAFYQKLYLSLATTPIIKRYLFKVRMRLELVGNDDEFNVRQAAAKETFKAIIITVLASLILMYINRESTFMMLVSLIGVLVVVENITEMNVSKIEDKLLNQQLDLFSEVRHAYHESNMVEEAIYDASLIEENEVNFQADKIYNIMIAPNPEMELEKYYDVAPNRFLKAFAGISYLTKEFGDRKVNDVSLYLKNMNNITQELQLEILKRQKIDYYFRSLSNIALAPILFIMPVKAWAESNFASTVSFYEGKGGYALQIFLLILIFACYALLKKVKDNGDTTRFRIKNDTPWQEKVYRIPVFEQFIDKIMPKPGKKEFAKIRKLLKDSASKLKMEWLYVNRVLCAILGFVLTLILFGQFHSMAIQGVLENATTTETVFGQMSENDLAEANALTTYDSFMISKLSDDDEIIETVREGKKDVAVNMIKNRLRELSNTMQNPKEVREDAQKIYNQLLRIDKSASASKRANIQQAIFNAHINYTRDDYTASLISAVMSLAKEDNRTSLTLNDFVEGINSINSVPLTEEQISASAERMYEKLAILTNEYIKWVEVVVAILIAAFMYHVPIFVMMFQVKMRQMDMEDEVMQFQTVILMLMHIERVSVEYIIEWLERFANIFKEPLSTCMNNYESGAWEALEQLKDDASYKPFIRIVESLQSAVENVKITDAFDELETERNFFQEKRKDANERLINKKAKIGKIIGFTPMVVLFVGYLIGPLIVVSMLDMGSYFTQLGSMI